MSSSSLSGNNASNSEQLTSLSQSSNKYGQSDSSEDAKDTGNSSIVETHYNSIEEKGLGHRNQSTILYLRNFNNWVKSMLIDDYLSTVTANKKQGMPIKVLDLCCGKGGDLFKWKKGNVNHVVCADIAGNAVADCQKRYEDLKMKNKYMFTAEFIVADCTRVLLRTKYKDPTILFDLVSCQFSFHYCFESLTQAETMLHNISDCLRPGGYFIGTIPNAVDIVGRKRKAKKNWFGNRVFTITFEEDLPEPYPLFGAKYNFHLHEVVDCPEYLVHFPTLERLAAKFGLKLIKRARFQNYYEEMKRKGESLLQHMSALETYPPVNSKLVGPRSDYTDAKEYFREYPGQKLIGTLSKSEWEVCTIYTMFAFQKVNPGETINVKSK